MVMDDKAMKRRKKAPWRRFLRLSGEREFSWTVSSAPAASEAASSKSLGPLRR